MQSHGLNGYPEAPTLFTRSLAAGLITQAPGGRHTATGFKLQRRGRLVGVYVEIWFKLYCS